MTATTGGVYRAEASLPLPHWPLTLMVAGYPVWFLTGLGGFMWVILAAPMAAALLRRRDLVVPRGIGWWMVFLVAVAGSVVGLDSVARAAGWGLRAGYYVAATVVLLYLVNGGSGVTVERIVRVFTLLWLATVAGGWLALVIGDVSFRSPVHHLMPAPLLENELLATLVRPGFADVQDIIGFPVPRPKAPFPYTNSWGSMLALLTPYALMSLSVPGAGLSRRLVRAGLVASIVPAVVSLNRGLWLSLGIGVVYATVRFGIGGQTRVLMRVGLAATALVLVISISPLGGLVSTRLDNGHSDTDRAELAGAAVSGALERPVFGWGAPRPNVRDLPSIGTHGQLWLVLFSHGLVGATAFVAALVTFWRHTRHQRTTAGVWANTVLVIALVQMPVYLMVPHSLFAVMAAVAVAVRTNGDQPVRARGPVRTAAVAVTVGLAASGCATVGTAAPPPSPSPSMVTAPGPVTPDGPTPVLGVEGSAAVRFGIAVKGSDPTAVAAVESQAGAAVGVVRVFARWDTPFPGPNHRELLDDGRSLHLSIRPRTEDGVVIPWAEVAAAEPGSPVHDRLVAWAEAVAPYGDRIQVTFNHEPETARSGANGSPEEFVAAWRRVAAVFEGNGAGSVPLVVVLGRGAYADGSIEAWYPGDDVVDVVGVDAYNWYDCQGTDRPWTPPTELLAPALAFAADHGKPLAVPEVASTEDHGAPGRKAEWIDALADAIEEAAATQPVAFVAWFSVADPDWPDCEWSHDSSPAATDALARAVARFGDGS